MRATCGGRESQRLKFNLQLIKGLKELKLDIESRKHFGEFADTGIISKRGSDSAHPETTTTFAGSLRGKVCGRSGVLALRRA